MVKIRTLDQASTNFINKWMWILFNVCCRVTYVHVHASITCMYTNYYIFMSCTCMWPVHVYSPTAWNGLIGCPHVHYACVNTCTKSTLGASCRAAPVMCALHMRVGYVEQALADVRAQERLRLNRTWKVSIIYTWLVKTLNSVLSSYALSLVLILSS